MVETGNPSNAPNLCVPVPRQTVMQFVICKPQAAVCKETIKICQCCEVSRVITQPELGWRAHPN
eukprot:9544776-Lingulodinium_polyedra.AAC.1